MGGVCIADEVQVGFGRTGSHMWGFEMAGVVPDIVALGKPIGNGHPMAAVVTTPAIAASFANGMEYFSTFGGNPTSCAVGDAVLGVIEDEGLQAHAARVGAVLMARLAEIGRNYPGCVGDVRGVGLFVGLEIVDASVVDGRGLPAPNPAAAAYIKQRMCDKGVLLSTDGPHNNVLKIKPPLVFDEGNAAELADALCECLEEMAADGFSLPPTRREH